ncbi:ankyrin repeat-containing domain protein, partial [Jimgerdemannia flammicorona]
TQSSPYQTQSSPYQTQSSPYQTQSSPYQTQSSPYQTQSSPYQTHSSPSQPKLYGTIKPDKRDSGESFTKTNISRAMTMPLTPPPDSDRFPARSFSVSNHSNEKFDGIHEHDVLTDDILNMLSPVMVTSPAAKRRTTVDDYFGKPEAPDARTLERNDSGTSTVSTAYSIASSDCSVATSVSSAPSVGQSTSDCDRSPAAPRRPINVSNGWRTTSFHNNPASPAQPPVTVERDRHSSEFSTLLLTRTRSCESSIYSAYPPAPIAEPHIPMSPEDARRITFPFGPASDKEKGDYSQQHSAPFGGVIVARPSVYDAAKNVSVSSLGTVSSGFSGPLSTIGDVPDKVHRTEALQYGGPNSLWNTMINPSSDEEIRIKILTSFFNNNGSPNIAKPTVNEGTLLYGHGLIHAAIITKSVKVLAFVLQAGANPDAVSLCATDEDKVTPIFLAAKMDFVEGIKLLVEYRGSIMNAVGPRKKTAFIGAAESGSSAALRQLIQFSSMLGWVNIPDAIGITALHWAAWFNQVDCVRILITEGKVNCEVSDKDGETPLHYAAKRGHVELIVALIHEFDMNVNVTLSKKVGTPLDVAKKCNKRAAENILKNLGGMTQKEVSKIWKKKK